MPPAALISSIACWAPTGMLGIEKPGAAVGPTVISLIVSPLAADAAVVPAAELAAGADVWAALVPELEPLSSPHAASTNNPLEMMAMATRWSRRRGSLNL